MWKGGKGKEKEAGKEEEGEGRKERADWEVVVGEVVIYVVGRGCAKQQAGRQPAEAGKQASKKLTRQEAACAGVQATTYCVELIRAREEWRGVDGERLEVDVMEATRRHSTVYSVP